MGVPKPLLSDAADEAVGLNNETRYSPWSLSLTCCRCIVFNVTDPTRNISTRQEKTGTKGEKTTKPFNPSMKSASGLDAWFSRSLLSLTAAQSPTGTRC